ncbi:DNA methyltransferase [uncultured Helicobacter sp.]|uniref:Eco57I restriction-modification methylase domain-containing protein n=1 Tax=uncultured Helicobacter sp. TaxID=175537 RepID=UPI002601CB96|nr:DNA methyltransferase [uncultured Helicobacter sp.]
MNSLQTFTTSPYTLEYFKDFIQQAFPQAQLLNSPTTPYKDGHIIHAYAPICQDIELESSHILQVFAFEVGSTHAKVTLHKELAKIAKNNASHILACFYDPSDTQEFRLSLITTGFDFEANKSTHSNLRRQSFVLGDSIPTHTAQKQLQTLIDSQAKSKQALEEAFSLEPVTKEFYKEIVGIFITLIDSIQLPAESQAVHTKQTDSKKREFALRLLSRLLFCKFLEKKGVIDQAIFSTTLSDNYYHEVLEPLFFSTLNTPKAKRNYDLLDPRVATLLDSIPYLNGGLFAPQASDFYSPQKPTAYHATLKVPNAPLAELFTLLESYHFSIDESTPDSQEVGLNPELLGLVFESLLSELFTDNRKDSTASLRKSTGSYYTPREIVRYMCRTSLYQFLLTKLDSALGSHSADLANFGATADHKSSSTPKFAKNHESTTANLRILEEESRAEQTDLESTFEKSHDFKDNAPAPSLRDTAPAVAWQSNSAPAESNQINGARKACNLESVQGDWGVKGGIRGDASQVAPLSPLEKTLSQAKLESSNNAKKVESSVDCHDSATAESRNDSKKVDSKKTAQQSSNSTNATILSEQAQDSRINKNHTNSTNATRRQDFGDKNGALQGESRELPKAVMTAGSPQQSPFLAQKPTPDTNEAIHNLIFHHDPTTLTQPQKSQILAALQSLKVLDPACGSGAFPIGLMQELLELGEILGDTRSPYTRKLEILQSNIYGIDIQPMATEISRLRCFLSLILEEAPRDIKPLPNLEFKFLSANSLLPLPQDSMLEYDGYQADKQKLESIRQDNFSADLSTRESLKQDYLKTAAHIARNLILHAQGESPLTQWNPYDPHSVAEFFDSEYMFGLSGFDIVIGNPPYISAPNQMKDKFLAQQRETLKNISYYKTLHKKWDLYIPFIERGLKILNFNGMCSMIIPYPYTNQPYAQKSRENIFKDFSLVEIADLHESKVFNAEVLNCIVFIQNNNANNEIFISKLHHHTIERIYKKNRNIFIQDEKSSIWNLTGEREIDKYQKLNTLGDFCYISVGMGLHSSESNKNYKFTKKDLISRTMDKIHNRAYIEGKDIEKYQIVNVKYLEYNTERCPSQCREPRFPELFEAEKLVINKIGYLKSVIDTNKTICDQTIRVCVLWHNLKNINNKSIISSIKKFSNFERNELENLSQQVNLLYLLGILNSKYIALLLDEIRGVGNIDLNPEYLRKLPIPKITESNQPLCDEIIKCVDKILESKAKDSTLDTQELESKIDSLVYKLYNLTDDEIKTIKGK